MKDSSFAAAHADDARRLPAVVEIEKRRIEELRKLTLKERGELLVAACRAAARIEESRQQMGMPPLRPAPWPESTFEYLRKNSPNADK